MVQITINRLLDSIGSEFLVKNFDEFELHQNATDFAEILYKKYKLKPSGSLTRWNCYQRLKRDNALVNALLLIRDKKRVPLEFKKKADQIISELCE